MPGPQRESTEALLARNSWRGKQRVATEPQDDIEAPNPPEILSKESRDHWDHIVPRLLARRTLTAADLGTLAGMCYWWGEFIAAAKAVAGLKKKPFKGHMVDHPRGLRRDAWEHYSKAAIQFGLTPAAKTRVQVASAPKTEAAKPQRTTLRIAQ